MHIYYGQKEEEEKKNLMQQLSQFRNHCCHIRGIEEKIQSHENCREHFMPKMFNDKQEIHLQITMTIHWP